MSGGNSVYSPLPQSNSDTDESSEEELHSSNESRVINKISGPQIPKQESISNGQKPNIIDYKLINDNINVENLLNGFQVNTDEVSIVSANQSPNKLSKIRKICFLLSLFLCGFTIVIFLWVLPCDTASCQSEPVSSGITAWEQTLYDIELHGPINVVPAAFDKKKNMVILYKNGTLKHENNTNKGGVISFMGNNGEVAWFVKLKRRPTDIDCSLIDVNLDGFNDCLVIGDDDMLKAIHSISGTELWDVHGPVPNRNLSMYHFEFPLILPDLDGDGVRELLTACSLLRNNTLKNQNQFVIISGKSGGAIGNPVEIKMCFALRNLVLEKDLNITYTCIDYLGKESVQTTSLPEICKAMKCPSDPIFEKDSLKNNQLFHSHQMDSVVRNVFQIEEKRLLIENKGSCPDCNVSVSVKDEREKANRTVYTFESPNGYAMMPVTISFGKIKGFIIKLWEWHFDEEEKNIYRKNTPVQSALDNENLDREMMSDPSFSKRFKRSGNGSRSRLKEAEERIVYRLSERVLLITFNKTDSRFINASHFEIIQLCKDSETCQPDIRSQSKSLLLTDLDQDGFQELISYTTSYFQKVSYDEGNPREWQLRSKIQVVRLETELPKLYDGFTKP